MRSGAEWAGTGSPGIRTARATSGSISASPLLSHDPTSTKTASSLALTYSSATKGGVYRTYFTNWRGVEAIGTVWSILDRTPLGRQENWEDTPDGRPQGPKFEWWRLHNRYDSCFDVVAIQEAREKLTALSYLMARLGRDVGSIG